MPTLHFDSMPDVAPDVITERQPDGSLAVDVPAGMRARIVVMHDEPIPARDKVHLRVERDDDTGAITATTQRGDQPESAAITYSWGPGITHVTQLGSFVVGQPSPEDAATAVSWSGGVERTITPDGRPIVVDFGSPSMESGSGSARLSRWQRCRRLVRGG